MAAKYIAISKELSIELKTMHQSGKTRLPSEAELCRRFSCSRQTIRSALALLEQNGVIVKRKGSGSYISDSSAYSQTVAVIFQDKNEYIYPDLIRDIKSVFSGKGFTVKAFSTNEYPDGELSLLNELLESPPAGIIMEAQDNLLPCSSSKVLQQLAEKGVPVVYLNCAYSIPSSAPCITDDNYSGSQILIQHLVEKGHRSISGIMKCNDLRGAERFTACQQACHDHGVQFSAANWCWFSSVDRQKILDGNDSFLQHFISNYLGSSTAVVCFNDEIAYHLVKALTFTNISVPDKIEIVSFDNSYYSIAGDVKFLSIGHDNHAAGTAAAKSLLSLISGKKAKNIVLPWMPLHQNN